LKFLKFWNLLNFMKFWKHFKFLNFVGIRYRVCDIGYKWYRLGTIIDNAYTKHLYFNLNIWYKIIRHDTAENIARVGIKDQCINQSTNQIKSINQYKIVFICWHLIFIMQNKHCVSIIIITWSTYNQWKPTIVDITL
jgi:hypothetical protein